MSKGLACARELGCWGWLRCSSSGGWRPGAWRRRVRRRPPSGPSLSSEAVPKSAASASAPWTGPVRTRGSPGRPTGSTCDSRLRTSSRASIVDEGSIGAFLRAPPPPAAWLCGARLPGPRRPRGRRPEHRGGRRRRRGTGRPPAVRRRGRAHERRVALQPGRARHRLSRRWRRALVPAVPGRKARLRARRPSCSWSRAEHASPTITGHLARTSTRSSPGSTRPPSSATASRSRSRTSARATTS